MIIEPPGDPTARTGLPSASTIVGLMELRGRFPPSTLLGWSSRSKLKSVSSLFSRKPHPGAVIPLPPVDWIVYVYVTTFPHRSATVRWVVFSPPAAVAAAVAAAPPPPLNGQGSPAGTGFVDACSVMRAPRP